MNKGRISLNLRTMWYNLNFETIILLGLALNTVWIGTLSFNTNYTFLDYLFNRQNSASFFYNFLVNILSFNWIYAIYLLLVELGINTNMWALPSFNDTKQFWEYIVGPLKNINIAMLRSIGSTFCPVTIYENISSLIADRFSFTTLAKKIDFYERESATPALWGNEFLFLGAFLFVSSTIISLVALSYLGLYGSFILNLITIIIFWCSVILKANFFLVDGNSLKIVLGKWFSLWGHSIVNFELYIDSLAYGYMLLTLTIAVFVFLYTFSYFRYEPNVDRLLLFINMFVISMLLLVTSGNFFVLFLGWELIGLTSFFLINFWSTRIGTLKAAFKAMTFNKVSDVSLFISLLIVYLSTYDSNFLVINSQLHIYQNLVTHFGDWKISYLELAVFFILIAAFIKSAQFGTHIWLPDSMEAPVPASALIHSATLVSAGVFLVLRFSPLFELSLYADYILTIIGSFTAFFGGWCAVYQSDAKRVLAYSTLSHCGFLIATCSTKVPELTMFYLYVHGFFKAAVFLCIGNLIRFSNNYQDFRRMGNIWKYMPFECIAALVCLLNLAGLPFTLGFFIKHILFSSMAQNKLLTSLVVFFIVTAAVAGLIYSTKLYFYIFFDLKKGKKYIYEHTNDMSLKSGEYSNTTLAANIAIIGLITIGYIISIYIYVNWFSIISINESLDLLILESSNFFNFGWPTLVFLKSASAVNWISLQVIISLFLGVWRSTFTPYSVYDSLFVVILSSIFFYASTLLIA